MRSTKTILFLWFLVLLVPGVCVVFGDWITSLARHRASTLQDEPNIILVQVVIAASPFFLLALLSSIWALWKSTTDHWRRSRIAAYWGLISTVLLWGVYHLDPFIPQGAGPNFGVMILLATSPITVGLVMLFGFLISKGKHNVPA